MTIFYYCRFNDPAVIAEFDEVDEVVDGVFLPVKGAEEPCDGCSNSCYPLKVTEDLVEIEEGVK